MKSNNLLKNVDIKNCICFYFDGSLSINDFDLQNILLDEKLHEKKKKIQCMMWHTKFYPVQNFYL